jgi:hypothetical protein
MLLEMLALLADAASPALPPPKVVSPLTITAQPREAPAADATVNIDSDGDAIGGQLVSVWPTGAWESRTNGHVTLRCFIDVHGLAERCRVAFESPPGRGFGAAALQLQPTLKLPPAKGADGAPIGATMNIALNFRAPDPQENMQDLASRVSMPNNGIDAGKLQLQHNPITMRRVTMMNHPVWVQAPSFDDLARAYPARGDGVEGYAVAHCEVARTGAIKNCIASKELPGGHGFAKAATTLAAQFRVSPETMKYAPGGAPVEVDIPIRLPPPAALADRTVNAPVWLAGVDPETQLRLYPPEAAGRGVASGRGVARCAVAADGSVTGCSPEAAEPAGLGFSEAAVKLASTMRMNLWSADGAPVEGGVVHLAFRLNLEPSQ